MAREVKAGETTASLRRVYFHLVGTDGITPALGEAGGQPQISIDGAAWADAGIGTLAAVGNGRYYATLAEAAVAAIGSVIETRYKSAATAECPGDTVVVVHDPYGVTDAAVLARLTAQGTSFTLTSPVDEGGTVRVVNGDDYKAARGNALPWHRATDLDLAGATWTLRIYDGPREIDAQGQPVAVALSVTCAAVATDGGYDVTAELTAAQTAALPVRIERRGYAPRRYEVVVTLAGDVMTQFDGELLVTE